MKDRTDSLSSAAPSASASAKDINMYATGNRVINLDLLSAQLLPHVRCPQCRAVGGMVARAQDEISLGIGGTLKLLCESCGRRSINLDQSVMLKQGSARLAETNVRMTLAAAQIGLGGTALERFCGVLNLPSLDSHAFDRMGKRLAKHMEAAGDESQTRAAVAERVAAHEAGIAPNEDGRIPIPIGFDAQWLKPGKAFNAPDGYGAAIGGRTGMCVKTCYRTKVGELKNHDGSSGSMEPAMGAEAVRALGTDSTGVVVGSLCLDLDAKTPKAVREECARDPPLPTPKGFHDPNHFVKTVKGRLIDIKSKVKIANVLPPETQVQIAAEVAMAVHQHNSKGDPEHLREAIMNVKRHAFNDHSRCREFFNCPCAKDGDKEPTRTESSYKGGLWLDEAGKREAEKKGLNVKDTLLPLMDSAWDAITTPAHMSALCHDYNTQVCEAMNGLHASMHPKRRDLSRGVMGRAIHKLCSARFNDGVCESTKAVLSRMGIPLGQVATIILEKEDQHRRLAAARKNTIHGKSLRKKAKAARKKRDAPTAGEGGASYGANSAMDDVPLGAEEAGEVAGDEPPVAARAQRKCGLCGMPGHTRRTCSQAAPAPAAQEEGEEAVEEGEK
jgi:antitoxin component of RelBE/YafQ-DinJ toxin-antitoxin module